MKYLIKLLFLFFLISYISFTGCAKDRDEQKGRAEICLVQYIDSPMSDDTRKGIIKGLEQSGLVEGREYTLSINNAQGDITTLNSIMDMAIIKNYSLVMVSSTPTLQAAINKLKNTDIVFTTVADPVSAGAGKSFTDHLPNVTGICTLGDYGGMTAKLRAFIPDAKKVGTLFSPGEINSVVNLQHFKEHAQQAMIEVVEIPVETTADVSNAALTLVSSDIDAVCQIICNITDASFPAIIKAARNRKTPVFGFNEPQIALGAVAVISRDYVQAGIDASELAVEIISGKPPSSIPIRMVSKSKFIINRKNAEKNGIVITDVMRKYADKIIE